MTACLGASGRAFAPLLARTRRESGRGAPWICMQSPAEPSDASAAERLAEFLAAAVARSLASSSPWLTADEAAEYLRCPLSRVRKLTMLGDLRVHRDGRRVLYHRDDLDEFVRSGGAFAG